MEYATGVCNTAAISTARNTIHNIAEKSTMRGRDNSTRPLCQLRANKNGNNPEVLEKLTPKELSSTVEKIQEKVETKVVDVVVSEQNIPDGQKALAKKFGIDTDALKITPELISCGQEKLGESRIQEIQDGDTPTTLETFSLLGCL